MLRCVGPPCPTDGAEALTSSPPKKPKFSWHKGINKMIPSTPPSAGGPASSATTPHGHTLPTHALHGTRLIHATRPRPQPAMPQLQDGTQVAASGPSGYAHSAKAPSCQYGPRPNSPRLSPSVPQITESQIVARCLLMKIAASQIAVSQEDGEECMKLLFFALKGWLGQIFDQLIHHSYLRVDQSLEEILRRPDSHSIVDTRVDALTFLQKLKMKEKEGEAYYGKIMRFKSEKRQDKNKQAVTSIGISNGPVQSFGSGSGPGGGTGVDPFSKQPSRRPLNGIGTGMATGGSGGGMGMGGGTHLGGTTSSFDFRSDHTAPKSLHSSYDLPGALARQSALEDQTVRVRQAKFTRKVQFRDLKNVLIDNTIHMPPQIREKYLRLVDFQHTDSGTHPLYDPDRDSGKRVRRSSHMHPPQARPPTATGLTAALKQHNAPINQIAHAGQGNQIITPKASPTVNAEMAARTPTMGGSYMPARPPILGRGPPV